MTRSLARPLDRAEAFFWLLDRCSSMNFAVLAEGKGPLDAAKLEAALANAQAIHPLLACAIEADASGRLSFVPRPGAPVAFSREGGDPDWRPALAARLAEPFALGRAPLLRAHWFGQPAGRWAFAIVFHHAIGDGRSGIRLVKDVIDEARGVRAQGPAIEPRPSLMTLFPASLAGESGDAKAQAWKATLRRETLRPQTMPGFVRQAGPERPAIVAIHLEQDAVQALARRARDHGASVHGVIGAAELIATRESFGEGAAPALMLTSPVDLRASLAGPVADDTPGFYVTLLSSIATVTGPADLWPLSQFLTADLRRQVRDGCGHLFYRLVPPAEAIGATDEGVAGFRAYLQRMPTACVLSNVGRIEALPEANGVRVDEISFALCPMAHQPVFAAATTWGGRLSINVVHDANRLAPPEARAIASAMERLLRQAAG